MKDFQKYELMLQDFPPMLTAKDVGEILSLSRTTTYNLLKSGRVKICRWGNSIRVPKISLIEFVVANSQ